MFCSNCGSPGTGKFCSNCGAKFIVNVEPPADAKAQSHTPSAPEPSSPKLSPPEPSAPEPKVPSQRIEHIPPAVVEPTPVEPIDVDLPVDAELLPDWRELVDYHQLLTYPEVRDQIANAMRQHKPQISSREIAALVDAVVPTGVSIEKLTVALVPIYERMGFKTGKTIERELNAPPGLVLVGTLCALAVAGSEVSEVQQAGDGCALTASLPSSMWTNQGKWLIAIQRRQRHTWLQASTYIPGQLFDFGHSRRLLEQFCAHLETQVFPSSGSPALRHNRNVA